MDNGENPSMDDDDYYDYNNYSPSGFCNKEEVQIFGALVTSVFFSAVIIFSLVGNILVLVILVKYENLKSLTNAFILNLAVSDLMFTLGLPFWAAYELHTWIFGEPVCKAVSFIFDTSFYSSIIFLTVMTIHRYMAVVHPLSVVTSRTTCYCPVISVAAWLTSLLSAAPALLKTTSKNDNDNSMHCEYNSTRWKMVGAYQQNAFFLVSFTIIAFCYVQILVRLLRPTSHTKNKTVKLILCIVIVFFMGWGPYNMALFLKTLTDLSVEPFTDCGVSTRVDYAFYICRLIAFSHCCLNPLFYVFVGVKFRNHLKKLLWYYWRAIEGQRRNSQIVSNGEDISMY
ncbi:chemokine XC receptor 1 isoform X2 [Denticeps clupeoides]|nr:chemokine XC receptor 1-like isoform X2 [Denticeps clupeoides]